MRTKEAEIKPIVEAKIVEAENKLSGNPIIGCEMYVAFALRWI